MKRLLCSLLFFTLTYLTTSAQKTWDGGAGTNNWNDANNWNPNGVPTSTDNVTIGNGFNVVLNTSTTIASLAVGGGISGQLTIGNNNTNRTLTVTANVSVNSGATITSTGNGGNLFRIGGNLANNGTFTDNAGDVDVEFNGTTNQTISGTGIINNFNYIIINNSGAANNNIVDVVTTVFNPRSDFLILVDGFLRISSNVTVSPFTSTGYIHIPAGCGLWNNGGTINTSGFEFVVEGTLQTTGGTTNIGAAANDLLVYISGSSINVQGGVLNAVGSIRPDIVGTSTVSYTQSGGTVICGSSGTTSTTTGVFDISTSGSSFTMTNGSIILVSANTSFAGADYLNLASTYNVTGGTVQFGNVSTPLLQTFDINSTVPFYNLIVNNINAPVAQIVTNNITVANSVSINSILNANNLNITVGKDWTNNGTFTAGTGTVAFNGNSLQTIGGIFPTTFNNITFTNTNGGISLSAPVNVSGIATFTNGVVATTLTNFLTMNAGSSVSGGSATSHVNGPIAKTGTTPFTFPVGDGTIYRTIGISTPSSSSTFRAQFIRSNPVIQLPPFSLGLGLTRTSTCEYWSLDRIAGIGTTMVTLSWGSNSACPSGTYVNDIASLRVARHTGGFWQDEGQTSNTGNNTAGTITSSTVSLFSQFTLAASGTLNPLPVTITQLSAVKQGAGVKLSFTNLTEEEIEFYEVQRSYSSSGFTGLQQILPRKNDGSEVPYDLFDALVTQATVFYRVKAKLKTGKEVFTAIVKVSNKNDQSIKILSNPLFDKTVTIQFNGYIPGNYEFELFNINGQKQFSKTVMVRGTSSTISLILPVSVPPGTYLLRIHNKELQLLEKLIIQ